MEERYLRTVACRFWAKVTKTDSCWIWAGARGAAGYGLLRVGRSNCYAHRVSWWLHTGQWLTARREYVCHTCDNPRCVRPDHLYLGSASDNQQDCIAKARKASVAGSRHPGAKLDETAVCFIRLALADGWTGRELAQEFGVTPSVISNIKYHTTWSAY